MKTPILALAAAGLGFGLPAIAADWQATGPEGYLPQHVIYDTTGSEPFLRLVAADDAYSASLLDTGQLEPAGLELLNPAQHIVADPVNDGGYFVTGESALIRVAADGSTSTIPVPDGFNKFDVSLDGSNIAVASFNEGIIYSNDGGDTFSNSATSFPSGAYGQRVIAGPNDPLTFYYVFGVFGGSSLNVYRSTDGGANFSSMSLPGAVPQDFAIDPTDGSHLLVASSDGVWRSTDGGGNWSQASTQRGDIVAFTNDGSGILLVDSRQLLVSSDNAASWSDITPTTAAIVTDLDPEVMGLSFSSGDFAVSTRRGVLRTTDGGSSWSLFTGGVRKLPTLDLARQDASGKLLLTTEIQGVYDSADDGSSWTLLNEDPGPLSMSESGLAVAIDPNNESDYLVSDSASIVTSIDGGETWTEVESRQAADINFIGDGLEAIAGTASGFLYSMDSGNSWSLQNGDLNPVPVMTGVAASPGDSNAYFASSPDGVLMSRDAGVTWTHPVTAAAHNIAVAQSDPDTVYAGGNAELHRSTDRGGSWETIGLTAPAFGIVYDLAVHPADASVIVVAGDPVTYSLDSGQNYLEFPVAPPRQLTRTVVINDGANADELFVGGDFGLYRHNLAWSQVTLGGDSAITTSGNLTTSVSVATGAGLGNSDVTVDFSVPTGVSIDGISGPEGWSCTASGTTAECFADMLPADNTGSIALDLSAEAGSGGYSMIVEGTSPLTGASEGISRVSLTFEQAPASGSGGGGSGGGGSLGWLLVAMLGWVFRPALARQH